MKWFAIYFLFLWNCLQSQDISQKLRSHEIIGVRGDVSRLERAVARLEHKVISLESENRSLDSELFSLKLRCK